MVRKLTSWLVLSYLELQRALVAAKITEDLQVKLMT